MLVRDVMSNRVISAGPDGAIEDVMALLLESRIGGVPVLDEGFRVVGIVSESDLQPGDVGTGRKRKAGRPRRAVADIMTTPVITLSEDDTVTEAARVLLRHEINRAPVVRDGVIVGMITRSDLLRPYLRTDSEITADVEEVLFGDGLGLRPGTLEIQVDQGVVHLGGLISDRRQQSTAAQLARGVEGVIDVIDELVVGGAQDPEPDLVSRPQDKGRVLLVESDARNRQTYGGWLEESGYEVLACSGPTAPDYTCVGGRTGACPLIEQAEVIVLDLELDSEFEREGTSALELLALYAGSGKPVIVLGVDPLLSELLLDGVAQVIVGQPSKEELIRAVRGSLVQLKREPHRTRVGSR